MAELWELALIPAKEFEDIAKGYSPFYGGGDWESRLMRITLSKDIRIISQILSLLDRHSLSGMSTVLKGVLCVGGVLTMSCNYCIFVCVQSFFHSWKQLVL